MNWRIAAVVAACAVFVASPYLGIPAWTPPRATLVAFTAISLVGLNLIFGVAGMLALGQAAFAALPGYVAGIGEAQGMPALPAIALGLVAAILVARAVAEVFVRLPGVYFAVGTLGFAFVLEGLARAFPSLTGGASGLMLLRPVDLGDTGWYAVAVALLAAALACYAALLRGPLRRRLILMRHDELAAAVVGIDVVRLKVRIFTIGSAYSALGGVLLAYYVGVLSPEGAGVNRSLEQLAMVIIGGSGALLGPVLGASLVEWLFALAGAADRYELLAYGVAIFAIVLFAPRGVAGMLASLGRHGPLLRAAPPALGDADALAPGARPALPPGPCLVVENVAKSFGALQAVDDVSLTIARGEIVALIGPNGAGKSTLFNLISGVERPSAGRIVLDGVAIGDLSIHARARYIGRSFQVPRLVPELTVLENVVVRLEQPGRRATEPQRLAAARAQLDGIGFAAVADTTVRTIGIGQHKLIDLARASVGTPPVLLLDEPAVGLSGEERARLAAILRGLKRSGAAILVVEHDVDFVADVADRVVVMDGGRCIADGTAAQVMVAPAVRAAYFG